MGTTRLNELSATACVRLMASGKLTSEALVEACLDRIAARDKRVRAWAFIDPDLALRQARERDRHAPRGKLHGIPLGLKDIIETADMPTEYNSAIYRGHRPDRDALSVARARKEGAVILGKTATSEFAFLHPAKTCNPHNLAHTPGGSSSGTVASVADFMTPLALGTQTGGSTIRPASYCGVYALKPTYARIPYEGVKVLSATFDTLGLVARHLEDLELLFSSLGESVAPRARSRRGLRIGYCKTPFWEEAQEETHEAMRRARAALKKAGVAIDDVALPGEIETLSNGHRTVMAVEATFSFHREASQHRGKLSRVLRGLIEEGLATPSAVVQRIRSVQAVCTIAVDRMFDHFDLLLTPSAPGEAERGHGIGNNAFNRMWTALHTPCLTIPYWTGPHGLPVGVQLVGRRGADEEFIENSRMVDRILMRSRG